MILNRKSNPSPTSTVVHLIVQSKIVLMPTPDSFSSTLKDAPFETIFRLNNKWTSIHVTPLSRFAGKSYYKIKMVDNTQVYIWKTVEDSWEEHTGTTLRAESFGSAIDTFYWCSDIYLA